MVGQQWRLPHSVIVSMDIPYRAVLSRGPSTSGALRTQGESQLTRLGLTQGQALSHSCHLTATLQFLAFKELIISLVRRPSD